MAQFAQPVQTFAAYLADLELRYGPEIAYRYWQEGELHEKTYARLAADARALSAALLGLGQQRQHMALLGATSYAWIISFLAVCCSNNVAIPLDKQLPPEELVNLLSSGDVEVLFLDQEFQHLGARFLRECPRLRRLIFFDSPEFAALLAERHMRSCALDPALVAAIFFTSGTTGISKGVMLSQRNLLSNICAIPALHYELVTKEKRTRGQPVLSVLPINHCFELTVGNFGMLYLGCVIHINDSLEHLLTNLQRFQPVALIVVPLVAETFYKQIQEAVQAQGKQKQVALAQKLNRCLQRFGIDASRLLFRQVLANFGGELRGLISGGAPLRPEVAEGLAAFGIRVMQGYGITECAPVVAANCPLHDRRGSSGRVIADTQVRIAGDGEILVRGPGVMLGYYGDEAATQAVLQDGWFHTGDLGQLDEAGYLTIKGRSKNLILLSNGENVYPEELESYLQDLPGVEEAVVYDDKGCITALIVPQTHSGEQLQQIRQAITRLNQSLPPYKRIMTERFYQGEFPKTTTRKIKREEVMRQLVKTQALSHSPQPPQNAAQQVLCAAFERALGYAPVGITDNFFHLGGESLAALALATELRISVQHLYENPTVLGLERSMAQQESRVQAARVDVNRLIAQSEERQQAPPRQILLTGASGYLGAHVLRELLRRDLQVTCLVRSRQRLEQAWRYYFGAQALPRQVRVLTGDLEQQRLGLEQEVYDGLAAASDAVIHTAANVSHLGYYEDFERVNVWGTQQVIDFCLLAGASLHHASTVSVSGAGMVSQSDPQALFEESILDIGQHYTQNVYVHSKYKAEERVLLARAQELGANIYRIGNLTWRARDGKFQQNAEENGFLARLKGLRKLRAYGREVAAYPVDFTPVDECAEALVMLALAPRLNRIYHLYHPDQQSVALLTRKLRLRCRQVGQEEIVASMRGMAGDKDVAMLAFYAAAAAHSSPIMTTSRFTVAELEQLGFRWSKINRRYLSHLKRLVT